MDRDTLKTLALALGRLATSGLPDPSPAAPFAFFNAWPLPGADPGAFVCEQGFRPAYLDLAAAGYAAQAELDDKARAGAPFAGAVVAASRNRAANEAMIARAFAAVRPGSPVVIAGAIRDGIKSLRKPLAGVTLESIAKHHAVAIVARRGAGKAEPPAAGAPSPMMFSPGRDDAGSTLLARHFDGSVRGDVADFGAGAGALSARLLAASPAITGLTLVEADWQSLKAARSRLAGSAGTAALKFEWLDLVRERPAGRFDWIVMNAPFHAGRAAEPLLGQAFVRAAAAALRKGGRLLMVANRGLPYEKTLGRSFARFEQVAQDDRYKVISATA